MKRSKMLEFMEFIISDYLGEKIHHPDVLSNVLLKEIEEAGMLPPFTDKLSNGKGYGWEPEDEKETSKSENTDSE
jgi:hypothetical protein